MKINRIIVFLEVKTFEGALIHVITFRNLAQPRNEVVALQTDIQVFSVSGYQQWRKQHPTAVNLLLLLPLKILLALQIRVGCLTNLHLVDVSDNLAINKLLVYPTVTFEPGSLSLTDAIFISEAARVTRFIPRDLGYFLTRAYETRIQLISKHTRPNNFFNEMTGHMNTDLNKVMMNEWELFQIIDHDVTGFVEEEFNNISNALADHRLKSKLLQQAAPVDRYCHVWTSQHKRAQCGQQNLANLMDWTSIRTKFKSIQVDAQYGCICEIDKYGTKFTELLPI